MKDLKFHLGCLDADLPCIQLDNGTWLFSAQVTCEFAEVASQANAARWVMDNVPKKWTQMFKRPNQKGRPSLYLLLPGFLYVLPQGDSEISLAFRDEVYEVVLPAIVEKGGYVSPTATPQQIEALKAQIHRLEMQNSRLNEKLLEQDKEIIEFQKSRVSESWESFKDALRRRDLVAVKRYLQVTCGRRLTQHEQFAVIEGRFMTELYS